ncbi:hypothetical protein GH714_018142 [Hevea brasiliensis]|uniref:Suppressor of forked domain-containing protein n=1 Tax=Hevea brasiliensis TaxID=3981 RepID=A0A6A6LT52_HEVBR|nr:hypothetical protein GH714_018142 [Hevea brasiliensis]
MSISRELYPSQDDLLYEEELLRNPFSLKLWWRYLIARREAPFKKRFIIYERALKALPGSYKLWHAYLTERLEIVRNLPVTHSQYETLNNTFERALVTMHKMPRIWIMYLQTLTNQKLITRARRTFDRALCALPVTQHDRIWELYLRFVSQEGMPIETSLRVYRRYLKYDPSHIEDFIEFLVNSRLWQEAAERLASVLNDDQFYSIKGKTKHTLWLELCDLLTRHAKEVSGLNVDAIIRGGIRKFTDEVGRLWTSLADYYIRRGLFEKARDIFEEGMTTVVTVRDFSVLFDAYSQFEESMVAHKMENLDLSDEEEDVLEESGSLQDEDVRLEVNSKFEKKILSGFWLHDDNDVDLMLARLEYLMDRRPELANSVLLRQNPHNVEQWHRRVKLFEGNPTKQILTYTEAVRTVDPMKALGKPHTLWVAFAKLYENHNDIVNARVIFDKAVQVNYKTVDNLASIWCEWAEMEIRHKNFKGALELLRRATAEPSVEVKRRVAADGNEPVQMKLHKSLRLWTFYVDLEEGLGTLESTRAVYERLLDLRIATPQIIINYALLLEAPADSVKPLYLQYAKLEEDYAEIFGVPKTREIYEQAIESGLPDKDVKTMCLKYAELEKSLGEIDRARGIYVFASQFADPRSDEDFWNEWHEFEVQHGNEDTFREMLRIKRSVSASYSQLAFSFTMSLGNHDEMAALERQLAPVANNATAKDSGRKVGFVSAGVQSQPDGAMKVNTNQEDIELPEESDSEDDEKVEITQKDVPSAVFGGLARKREETEEDKVGDDTTAAKDKDGGGAGNLGALERIKRQKRG